MTEKNAEKNAVRLDAALYARILKAAPAAGFDSADAYVAFVMEQVLSETQKDGAGGPDEDEKVKKRLRALGYME